MIKIMKREARLKSIFKGHGRVAVPPRLKRWHENRVKGRFACSQTYTDIRSRKVLWNQIWIAKGRKPIDNTKGDEVQPTWNNMYAGPGW